jgi:hypothetical protein
MLTACLFFHPFIPIILFGLYFLPTILAAQRNHDNVTGVFLLNFFLGWTVLGWIGALLWVTSSPSYASYHPVYAAPYPAQTGLRRCHRCGCGVAPGTAFCTYCGSRV